MSNTHGSNILLKLSNTGKCRPNVGLLTVGLRINHPPYELEHLKEQVIIH